MNEHFFTLNLTTERGQESFTCTGDNSELYRHSPQYKEVDHVFVRISETDFEQYLHDQSGDIDTGLE